MRNAGKQTFFEGEDVTAGLRAGDDDGFAHALGSVSPSEDRRSTPDEPT
jgi:hypothetical protein